MGYGFMEFDSVNTAMNVFRDLHNDLKETEGDRGENAVETVSKWTATPVDYGDFPHGLSIKDSLAIVQNATQAAARIYQVFRVQSFQQKQLKEYGDGELGMSDERALSLGFSLGYH
ncbi:unnamed protein product [Fraxinus pennsylvanica]|uniref:Uncharacterized protein n=1 Tax=Fraxinus pennsylvanica TaxID=56036 RepID=A0AAD2A2R3_9LAMI|nr:unnamed protein product [Fraxinus pennsylvanica]